MPLRERPIIMSAPMVRAILAGTKTQTRRLVKSNPGSSATGRTDIRIVRICSGDHAGSWSYLDFDGVPGISWRPYSGAPTQAYPHPERCCPHGVTGDRLWVKEAFAPDYFGYGKPGFRADWSEFAADVCPEPKWNSPLFLPRRLSRITLEITDVRVQRVQDISEDDARAEGVEINVPRKALINGEPGEVRAFSHRVAFAWKWDEINGKRATFASNPFVWAITFKRIEL